jgi:hypothetical protein
MGAFSFASPSRERGKHVKRRVFSFDGDTDFGRDPILARILTLDSLDHEERLNWIHQARAALSADKARLAKSPASDGYDGIARDARSEVIDIYLNCLDELLTRMMGDAPAADTVSSDGDE